MFTNHDRGIRPPQGSRLRDWSDIEVYARRRYSRRQGRPLDDPDVLDYGQEVVSRIYRRYQDNPERYTVGDEFFKLVLGVMKFVAKEKWRARLRWQQLVSSISQRWEEFVSSPDPNLLEWQDDFELIRVPVEARSGEKTFEAFRLVQFEGLSSKEAADQLGISPQAVYSARYNVMERLIEEEGFMRVERLLNQVHRAPGIRRAIADAKARCPKSMHALIERLYDGDVPGPGRPDRVDASPKALYQARAAFLRELEPLLLKVCRLEEGLHSDD